MCQPDVGHQDHPELREGRHSGSLAAQGKVKEDSSVAGHALVRDTLASGQRSGKAIVVAMPAAAPIPEAPWMRGWTLSPVPVSPVVL